VCKLCTSQNKVSIGTLKGSLCVFYRKLNQMLNFSFLFLILLQCSFFLFFSVIASANVQRRRSRQLRWQIVCAFRSVGYFFHFFFVFFLFSLLFAFSFCVYQAFIARLLWCLFYSLCPSLPLSLSHSLTVSASLYMYI